jgi:putative hydrolase
MDAIAPATIPGHEALREAMTRRRQSRSWPQRVLERLLGFDVKLRQYEQGKQFADAVVELAGIEALNRVWSAPSALPSSDELQHPGRWLDRTGRQLSAPA